MDGLVYFVSLDEILDQQSSDSYSVGKKTERKGEKGMKENRYRYRLDLRYRNRKDTVCCDLPLELSMH